MASRDPQTVVLSRQAILLVTAVGVGLLTLCYVLGVQVGKQSAALRRPLSKGAGEELEELPATMVDQLKALEQSGTGAGFEKAQKAPSDAKDAKADKPQAAEPPPPPKAEPAPKPAEAPGQWTLQLVSTPDSAEARAVLAKAKAAGYVAETITEKGLFKVRLTAPMKREAADASIQKLRNRGFKPFAIKVN
jgi:cell division septation protein DedD